jgi:hypothetical protein
LLPLANIALHGQMPKNPRGRFQRCAANGPSRLGQAGLSIGIENLTTIGLMFRS